MAENSFDHEKEQARLTAILVKRQKKMLELWPKLLMAVMALVVVIGIYTYMKHAQEMAEQQTWKAIAQTELQTETANLPAALEKVIQENQGTNATFYANIEILRGRFDAGEIAPAKAAAEKFLQEHADNYFAPQIRLEYARLLEYDKKYSEARAEYEQVIADGKPYLQPEALLGNARCYELEGRLNEARISYLRIKELAANNYWPRLALMTANLRLLALENPMTTLEAAPIETSSEAVPELDATPEPEKAGTAVPEEKAAVEEASEEETAN
ncbi:MAG: tetratricopeptide repeat protein [Planctomycetes bacterium]|nr:tetratricopeptide repeat protein [Planctomycetota bacterium]